MRIIGKDDNEPNTLVLCCYQHEYDMIPREWFTPNDCLIADDKEINLLVGMGVCKNELDGYSMFMIIKLDEGEFMLSCTDLSGIMQTPIFLNNTLNYEG